MKYWNLEGAFNYRRILTVLGKLVFSVALIFFFLENYNDNKQKRNKHTNKQTESYTKSLILIKFIRRKESVFTTQIYGNKRGVFTHSHLWEQMNFFAQEKSPTPTGFV